MAYFRNDFIKWHAVFASLYALTFIAGLLRGTFVWAYRLHTILGMATVGVSLLVYLLLPNKRVVIQMFKSNFSMRCGRNMKIARISTLVIMFYFFFSVVSGVVLNMNLYGTRAMYNLFHGIHGIAKIIVPLAVGVHVVARLSVKKKGLFH